MNRTIAGRMTLLRGLRDQVEMYIRYSLDLRSWAPVVIVVLLYVARKSYSAERRTMREERMSDLRSEKPILDRTDRV